MSEDRDQLYDEHEQMEIVRRYEEMVKKNTRYYFDVHEFVNIIDYYLETNKFQEALDANALAIDQHPEDTSLQLKKAQVLLDKGQPAETLKLVSRIEKIENSNFEIFLLKGNAYCILGKVKMAIRQFDRALELTFEDKEEILYDIALSFEHISQYHTAIEYLIRANKINPQNSSFLYDLAYCYERTGDLSKSIEFYKKFLDLDVFSEHIWYNLGNVYFRAGKNKEALECYDYALAIDPEYFSVYFNKANVLISEDKYMEAIEVYREFLILDEDSVPIFCYIGECYEKLGDYPNAKLQYTHALELESDSADAWFGLAMVSILEEIPVDTILYLKKAIHCDKENTEYWFHLGKTYMQINKLKEADKCFLKIIDLDSDDYEAYLERAQIQFLKHDPAASIGILEKVKDQFSGIAIFELKLSLLYLIDDQLDLSVELFESSLSRNTQQIDIEEYIKDFPDIYQNEPFKSIIEKFNFKKES